MDDTLYKDLVQFFTSPDRKYPDEIYSLKGELRVNAKSKFRQVAKPYNVNNGALFHKDREVLQSSRTLEVLKACHNNPVLGGHFGGEKTYQKIAERYYWKGMKQTIESYCRQCETCFKFNPKISSDAPPLHPIPVPSKVWSLIGIDLIGPLQETKVGNKYIVAATDYFSKWTEAAAIPCKTAECVAEFLFNTVCRHGCMDGLISDQGREFVNHVIDKLLVKLDVEHRISSPYHPQSNGQRERDNRTLKNALSKLVNDNGDNWDELIPGVLFAYHTSVHSSTKFTPFEIFYGRKAKLPLDISALHAASVMESENINDEFMKDMKHMRQEIHMKSAENISKSKVVQKSQYDKKHQSEKTVDVGTVVYLKNARRINRMGSKLEPRWIGPYNVSELMDKGRVRLKNIRSGQKLRNVYHLSNVKIFDEETKRQCNDASDSADIPFARKRKASESKASRKAPRSAGRKSATETNMSSETMFNPMPANLRKKAAKQMKLDYIKPVYFGKPSQLTSAKRIHKVKGDGNCYFRSISYILTGSENSHLALRDFVVKHMVELGTDIENYLSQNIRQYMDSSSMASNGIWATDAEVMGTASALKTDIFVFCRNGKSGMSWLRYPASFSLNQATQYAMYIQNVCGNHFDVVISVV